MQGLWSGGAITFCWWAGRGGTECSLSSFRSSRIRLSPFLQDSCLPVHIGFLSLETSLVAQTVKRLPAMQETWVQSLGQEVLLSGKSHGWRSLVGYSSWGRKDSDTTERLHFRTNKSSPMAHPDFSWRAQKLTITYSRVTGLFHSL